MRRGYFGGTFDPPHVGHLLVASDAHAALRLDRLTFVPNARQPLKADTATTSPALRLEMVRRAVEGDPRFDVDPIEVERGGTSYSVDTLEHFAEQHPEDDRVGDRRVQHGGTIPVQEQLAASPALILRGKQCATGDS